MATRLSKLVDVITGTANEETIGEVEAELGSSDSPLAMLLQDFAGCGLHELPLDWMRLLLHDVEARRGPRIYEGVGLLPEMQDNEASFSILSMLFDDSIRRLLEITREKSLAQKDDIKWE